MTWTIFGLLYELMSFGDSRLHMFYLLDTHILFLIAGTPFGCADLVKTGVEPNEHGTWLYGRNGWCDGRNVFPWVVDVTKQVKRSGFVNTIEYHGFFNGTDPNPKQNPGIIYIYSYLIFYEKHL